MRLTLNVGLACAVLLLGGCETRDQVGFVEVRRSVALSGTEQLVVDSTELRGLAHKERMIVQLRPGPAKLQIKRGEAAQDVCEFVVRKDRVVTVTLVYVNSALRCSVQG